MRQPQVGPTYETDQCVYIHTYIEIYIYIYIYNPCIEIQILE